MDISGEIQKLWVTLGGDAKDFNKMCDAVEKGLHKLESVAKKSFDKLEQTAKHAADAMDKAFKTSTQKVGAYFKNLGQALAQLGPLSKQIMGQIMQSNFMKMPSLGGMGLARMGAGFWAGHHALQLTHAGISAGVEQLGMEDEKKVADKRSDLLNERLGIARQHAESMEEIKTSGLKGTAKAVNLEDRIQRVKAELAGGQDRKALAPMTWWQRVRDKTAKNFGLESGDATRADTEKEIEEHNKNRTKLMEKQNKLIQEQARYQEQIKTRTEETYEAAERQYQLAGSTAGAKKAAELMASGETDNARISRVIRATNQAGIATRLEAIRQHNATIGMSGGQKEAFRLHTEFGASQDVQDRAERDVNRGSHQQRLLEMTRHAQTIGKSASEVAELKASWEGATAAQAKAEGMAAEINKRLEEQAELAARTTSQVKSYAESLQTTNRHLDVQISTFQKGVGSEKLGHESKVKLAEAQEQINHLEAESKKNVLNDDQKRIVKQKLDEAKAEYKTLQEKLKVKDAQEKEQYYYAKGIEITKRYGSSQQKIALELKEIREAYESGAIGADVYQRAVIDVKNANEKTAASFNIQPAKYGTGEAIGRYQQYLDSLAKSAGQDTFQTGLGGSSRHFKHAGAGAAALANQAALHKAKVQHAQQHAPGQAALIKAAQDGAQANREAAGWIRDWVAQAKRNEQRQIVVAPANLN